MSLGERDTTYADAASTEEAGLDDDFVREVYHDCYHRLVGQLFGICGDLGSAEEVVQEAFVKAMTHSRSFRSAENPQAWLRRVAINAQRNRWRSSTTHARLAHKVAVPRPLPDLSPDHVALIGALRALSADQREAIVLHHIADLSVQEVAASLSVPEGTVKARLSRGRTALALMLAETEEGKRV